MKTSKPAANRKTPCRPATQTPACLGRGAALVGVARIRIALLARRDRQAHVRIPSPLSRKKIFAALPHSRGFGPEASILLKFDPMPPALLQRAESDARLHSNSPGKGWFSFTLSSDTDLHDALEWLNRSYESAKGPKSR